MNGLVGGGEVGGLVGCVVGDGEVGELNRGVVGGGEAHAAKVNATRAVVTITVIFLS